MTHNFKLRFTAVIMTMFIMVNVIVSSAATVETETNPEPSWKDKIDKPLFEKMEKEGGKLPVWVWFKDIDDEVISKEVYERTGLTEDDLNVIDENISDDLSQRIVSIEEQDEKEKLETRRMFQEYMDRTQEQRQEESKRTDEYIAALREVQDEIYPEHNRHIFNDLKISQKDIISAETIGPFYILNLNAYEIEQVAKNENITYLAYYENAECIADTDPDYDDLTAVMNASEVSRIRSELSLNGSGISMGIIEQFRVMTSDNNFTNNTIYVHSLDGIPNSENWHTTFVARIAGGSRGVAPNSTMYSCPAQYDNEFKSQVNYLVSQNVHLVNMSAHLLRDSIGTYDPIEKFVDYITYKKRLLFVKTAGNNDNKINVPGNAFNVITVGGFFNSGSVDDTRTKSSTDIMFMNSNYYLNSSACFKPEVIAPQVTGYQPSRGTGTSYAAPVVTGTIALLFKIRPSLANQPEAVKAIIMSSCHRKVANASTHSNEPSETMEQGLTAHQGAGAINPYLAVAITASGNYGIRTMNASSTSETVSFKVPSYESSGLNCSIAWLRENSSENIVADEVNLDLNLYRKNTLMRTSAKVHSSAEMAYIPLTPTGKYYAQIVRTSATGNKVRFAYAFSVDKNRYQYTNLVNGTSNLNEGLYFIKNKQTCQYLTNTSGNVAQNPISYVNSQIWLVKGNRITSASPNYGKLYSYYNSGVYKATVNDNYYTNIKMVEKTETIENTSVPTGYYNIKDNSSGRVLGIPGGSSTYGTQARWSASSSTDEAQLWYFERAAYEKGDVDMDGEITSNDRLMVLRYTTNIEDLNEIQKFLGDVDCDGVVDANDALLIGQMLE